MPRTPVVTRVAVADDVPVLHALWQELAEVGARAEKAVNPVVTPDIAERLADAIQRPDCRVVLAFVDDTPRAWRCSRPSSPIRCPTAPSCG